MCRESSGLTQRAPDKWHRYISLTPKEHKPPGVLVMSMVWTKNHMLFSGCSNNNNVKFSRSPLAIQETGRF